MCAARTALRPPPTQLTATITAAASTNGTTSIPVPIRGSFEIAANASRYRFGLPSVAWLSRALIGYILNGMEREVEQREVEGATACNAAEVQVAQPCSNASGVELGAEIRHRLPPLRALTSLRFFAAMHVVMYHLSQGHIWGGSGSFSGGAVLGSFLASGYTGVWMFFTLSGFIMAYNYREVQSKREFWVSRFARIYPVYLLALLLSFAYAFAPATPRSDHIWLRLAASATLLQAWYRPFSESFNGPGWTLSVEACFYLLFPFLLGWIRRMRRRTAVALCAVYSFAMGVPLLLHMLSPTRDSAYAVAAFLDKGQMPPLELPLFLIGVYLGAFYVNRPEARRSNWPLAAGVVGSLVLLCWTPSPLFAPLRRGLLTLAFAALIRGLASVRTGWLTRQWMVLAGEISFSIYILQMPVMRTVLGLTRRLRLGFYGGAGASLVVLIGVSYLSYRFVELPARVAVRERFTRRRVVLEGI